MRSTRFQSEEQHFHFATRITHSDWLSLNSAQRWRILKSSMMQLRRQENLQWTSAVLMGTHFHLLFSLKAPKENILMNELENLIAKSLPSRATDSPLFETPWLCEKIESIAQFRRAYKYVYRNPVEAGLCRQVEEYPWSSLRELLNCGAESLFIDSNSIIQNPYKTLRWLNSEADDTGLQSSFLS